MVLVATQEQFLLLDLNYYLVNYFYFCSHQRPMRTDDEVRLGVFVDESGAGLEPLPLTVFGLESISD